MRAAAESASASAAEEAAHRVMLARANELRAREDLEAAKAGALPRSAALWPCAVPYFAGMWCDCHAVL